MYVGWNGSHSVCATRVCFEGLDSLLRSGNKIDMYVCMVQYYLHFCARIPWRDMYVCTYVCLLCMH